MTSKTEKARQTRQRNLAAQHEKEQAQKDERAVIRAALLRALADEAISPSDATKSAMMLMQLDGIA